MAHTFPLRRLREKKYQVRRGSRTAVKVEVGMRGQAPDWAL